MNILPINIDALVKLVLVLYLEVIGLLKDGQLEVILFRKPLLIIKVMQVLDKMYGINLFKWKESFELM